MIIKESLTALVIAFIIVVGYLFLFRPSRTRYGSIWLFLIVFVATWAGGVWIRPLGSQISGVYWLTFVFAGIIAIGLIGLFIPHRPPHGRHETLEKLEEIKQGEKLQEVTTITLGVMFWVVFSILIIGIIYRYLV